MSEMKQIHELLDDELYYTKVILRQDMHSLNFMDLRDEVRNKALLLYLEYMEMDIPEILYNNESDMMKSLKVLLLKPTTENKVRFANDTMRLLIDTYYANLQEILDDRVSEMIGHIEYDVRAHRNLHYSQAERV